MRKRGKLTEIHGQNAKQPQALRLLRPQLIRPHHHRHGPLARDPVLPVPVRQVPAPLLGRLAPRLILLVLLVREVHGRHGEHRAHEVVAPAGPAHQRRLPHAAHEGVGGQRAVRGAGEVVHELQVHEVDGEGALLVVVGVLVAGQGRRGGQGVGAGVCDLGEVAFCGVPYAVAARRAALVALYMFKSSVNSVSHKTKAMEREYMYTNIYICI